MIKPISNDSFVQHINSNGGVYLTTGTATGNFFCCIPTVSGTIDVTGCPGLTGTLTGINVTAGFRTYFPGGTATVAINASAKLMLFYL